MRGKKYGALAIPVAATLLLFAFGASSLAQGTSPSNRAASSTSGVDANLSALQVTISSYQGIPSFTAPGPALEPSKFRGKTILNIPDSTSNPFAAGVAAAEQEAAKVAGVNYIICTNQGEVTQWAECYSEAIGRHVNLIDDFGGADPRELGPQIQQAQSAGITVVAENVYGFSQKPEGGIKYSIPTPYEEAGKLMADWVVLDTKANADVLVITSNEVLCTAVIVKGIKQVFGQYCPHCKLTYVNVPVADWATRIQGDVLSALTADPKLNYVIPIYDSMTEYVIPAITAARRIGKTFVSTFNGTPFVLKDMQDGNIVRMDIGEDLQWVGWAFIDADLRLLSGAKLPSVFNEHTPLRIFTKQNVNDAGVPPQAGTGYGNAYISGYKALWGGG